MIISEVYTVFFERLAACMACAPYPYARRGTCVEDAPAAPATARHGPLGPRARLRSDGGHHQRAPWRARRGACGCPRVKRACAPTPPRAYQRNAHTHTRSCGGEKAAKSANSSRCEDAETSIGRAEARTIILKSFRTVVAARNSLYLASISERWARKAAKGYEIGRVSAARARLGAVDTAKRIA